MGYRAYRYSNIDWLGDIPEHWDFIKLKHVANVVLGKMLTPEDKGGYVLKSYLKAKNIEWMIPNLSELSQMWFSERELFKYRIHDGDLLVSEGGEVGRTCIWSSEVEECYIQNSVHKVSIKSGVSRYYLYQFVLYGWHGHFDAIVNRISIAHLTKEKLCAISFIVPPVEEQTQIARYLDYKTAKIDELIEKKQRLIQLLEEERTAIINQAVTKGLNPDVPMKDSGIEWLGEIPEHWKTSSLKWYAKIYAGGTPSKNIDEYWTNGTIPWLNSGTVNQGDIITPSAFITEEAYNSSSTRWIPKGGLVMALAGQGKTKGMVAQLLINATCNQSMAVIIPNEIVHSRFLLYWLRKNYLNIRNLGGGDKRDGLNLQMLGGIPIPIPPLNEQLELVRFVEDHIEQIQKRCNKLVTEIELLKEYKTALISEVVTGKVDVRDEIIPEN